MGGGFGGKEMQPHGLAAVAALGATLTGRPVRLRLNRTQDMTMTGKRHGFHAQWRVGFDDDGRLQALDATLTSDGGWSLDLSEPVLARALCHVDNAYWIPDVRVNGRIARTNKTSQTAFRGFGGPQGMLVIEDILGRCAPLLGIDPSELRRRNVYVDGQATPYGQPVRHAERLVHAWDDLTARADLARRRDEVAAFNATHPHAKRGLAITPVKFGISFNFTTFNQAGALVHVYTDGSVLINHGGTEMGQGLHTKMLQVAATSLGLPLSRVRLAPTRTDKVPNTSATAASSGADLNGGAVKHACEQITDRLVAVAAAHLGVEPSSITITDGVVSGGSGETLTWEALVALAYAQRVQLWAAGFYRTEGLHWDSTAMQGSPFKYFAYGVAAAEVEVDGFTGAYRTRRVDIVHDVGDSLSPLVDIGQIEGGFVQGAGWLTLEDLRWDESDGPTSRPPRDAVGQHLQAAVDVRDARGLQRLPPRARARGRGRLRLQGGRRATAHARLLGARGTAPGSGCLRPRPCSRPPRHPGHPGGGVVGHRVGPVAVLRRFGRTTGRACRLDRGQARDPRRRTGPARARCASPRPGVGAPRRVRGGTVSWLSAVQTLREQRRPGVLVTITAVRGHAPRDAGAKMVVASDESWGTIGGGNLEATALERARAMLAADAADTAEPTTLTVSLSDKAPSEHGQQCCGGEVVVLLEPLRVVPAVAIFGVGHVGLELARILARHDLELHLIDSRSVALEPSRLAVLADAVARRPRAPLPRARGRAGPGAGGHPRARHDARPRRGRRPLRRRTAVRSPRLDRSHRIVGEVGSVRGAPAARGP